MQRPLFFAILLVLSAPLSLPLVAQTSTDDLAATENWWDRVGARFFSDDGLTTIRPEAEIRAQWTGLSADDQAAVRARCAALAGVGDGEATSQQQGANTGLGGSNDTAEAKDNANETAADGAPADSQAQTSDLTPKTADQTSVTGATGGNEVQQPAQGTAGYTGLAGGNPDDGAFAPVCKVIMSI